MPRWSRAIWPRAIRPLTTTVGTSHDEIQPLMAHSERREADSDNGMDASAPGRGRQGGRPDALHPDPPLESGSTLQVEQDSRPSTPRLMQDENARKRWGWVPYPLRRAIRAVGGWIKGPADPRPYRIQPLLPAIQEYPLRLVERFLPRPKHRVWVLLVYMSVWLVTLVLVKRRGATATDIAGWGQTRAITCGASYWGADNACGLDGSDCRPFTDGGYGFRCPANCRSYLALNPRAVGDGEVAYKPLVVGGPAGDEQPGLAVYRGDSYICGAAIHAGVISNMNGGCGVVELVGRRQNFVSSQRNGITSVGFDSYFPLSFRFAQDVDCSSEDTRWSFLAASVVFTAVLSLFTVSPALFFFSSYVGVFWTVGMALDSPPHRSVAALFSTITGRFLPAMFVGWVMYDRMGVRRTLGGLTAQVEKTILWLGGCWVGAMSNYTFDFMPIQRLHKHDLEQQPGAKAALTVIVLVLTLIVASQVCFFRQEGRLVKYMELYGLLLAGIVAALVVPGLNLRIHHYIMALLLLPGTSLQMRPSLLYQGLLVGLFLNGIARWGFDPVLQTSRALQGDAQKGTLLPTIHAPVITVGSRPTITFGWDMPPGKMYDGISILVNDVERFRTYFGDAGEKSRFVWSRNGTLGLPEYFRFALMSGSDSGDYTKAGTWTADGQWRKMQPGPSKVRIRSVGGEERGGRRRRRRRRMEEDDLMVVQT